MKAMILAAGKGERLRPLTDSLPKPLFPVVNIPLIRYNIEFLKHHGVREIMINLFHLPRIIDQELGDGSVMGVKIHYSHEKELWGTGGGLKLVEDFFAEEEYFILINSDILIDCDLEDAIHFHRRENATATMILTQDASARTYGAVELDESFAIRNIAGRLDDVRESKRIQTVFTGVHILSPRIFEYIPPNITSCINAYAYPKMIQNNESVFGYIMQGHWSDLGMPETFYHTNMAFLDRKIKLRYYDPMAHFTLKPEKDKGELACLGEDIELGQEIQFHPPFIVGHNARIGDNATIGPYAIIGDGSMIGKQSTVSDSIIFAGSKIGNNQRISNMILNRKYRISIPKSASNTLFMESIESEEKKPTE